MVCLERSILSLICIELLSHGNNKKADRLGFVTV